MLQYQNTLVVIRKWLSLAVFGDDQCRQEKLVPLPERLLQQGHGTIDFCMLLPCILLRTPYLKMH